MAGLRRLLAVIATVAATTAAMAAALMAATGAAAQERAITKIAGDLYRFQNNAHFSVFLVTPDGVIATDPLNADAARWLKAQIAERFEQPVRYVIYSHHHGDHVSGGDVFADTATFIGHANMAAALAGQSGGVRPPDLTFADTMTVRLGGKTVELSHLGRNHTDNSIVMRFPDARTVFAVDFVTVKRLPFRGLGDSFLPDWITSLERLEAMDFDILAPGHGAIGTKADAADHRGYLEDLTAAVQAGIDAGTPLVELQQTIRLDQYSDWGQYEAWLPQNIVGAHRLLSDG